MAYFMCDWWFSWWCDDIFEPDLGIGTILEEMKSYWTSVIHTIRLYYGELLINIMYDWVLESILEVLDGGDFYCYIKLSRG